MKRPRILTVGIATILALPITVHAVERNWFANPGTSDWNDPANWDANGVPVSGSGDNIYIHTPGSITGVAIDANLLYMAVGTAGDPLSGFTFGAGTYNIGTIFVGEGHIGNGHSSTGPINNTYGRAFINAGTTVNVSSFHLGEWDGGSGHVVQNGGALNITNQFRLGHWPQAGGAHNSYTLNGGTVTVTGGPGNPLAEGQAGNVILGVDSSGTLTINGGTFNAHGLTMQTRTAIGGESKLQLNGGTLNIGVNGLVTSNPGVLGSYEVALKGGTVRATQNWSSNLEINLESGGTGVQFETNARTVTLSGNVIGAGSLTKVGAGTLRLSGTNNFAGGLNVNTGNVQIGIGGTTGTAGSGPVVVTSPGALSYNRTDSLTITNAVSGNGTLNVATGSLLLSNVSGSLNTSVITGATLGVAGALGPVFASGGSTLQAGVGGTGNFTASALNLFGATLRVSAGTSNTSFNVTNAGGLFATGANTIQISPVNLTVGTYTVVDYAGAIGGGGFAGFSLAPLPARTIGSLVDNAPNTSIDLNISAIDYPKWTGATDDLWDSTTPNWELVIGGGPTTYLNLDAVLFDDSATGSGTVDLTATFTPSSVVFDNSALPYIVIGTGGLSGAMELTKRGTGRTTIANTGVNDYTGSTTVQAGTLQIGDGSAGSLGTDTTVTVAGAGTVELDLPAGATYGTRTSGSGTVRTIGFNNVTIGADVLSGGLLLELAGISTVNVNNQPAFDGAIVVTDGTLRALGTQALGTTTGNTVISGGTLDVNALDLGGEHVFVQGVGVAGAGAIVNNGGDTVFNLHRVTLTGDATFGGTGRWDMRTTGITGELLDLGGYTLTKVGPNQVSLVNVNATEGNINIKEGVFSIEADSQVQGAGTITLNSGGRLGLWVNQPGRLTRQIVANGGGIIELGSGALTTVDSPISMQANLAIDVGGGTTVLNYVGDIVESGGPFTLNKDGDARLVLLGNNVWTGGFNVNAGVLQVGNGGTAGTLGTGESTVNAALVFAKSSTSTIDGDINPGGPAGTLVLAADGGVTLASGTDVKVSSLQFGVNGQDNTLGGTLYVGADNSVLVQDSVVIGNTAGGGALSHGIIIQTGGTVDVNAPNTDGRNFVLGHWNQGEGTYDLSAGTLNSPNISMAIAWDGTGTST